MRKVILILFAALLMISNVEGKTRAFKVYEFVEPAYLDAMMKFVYASNLLMDSDYYLTISFFKRGGEGNYDIKIGFLPSDSFDVDYYNRCYVCEHCDSRLDWGYCCTDCDNYGVMFHNGNMIIVEGTVLNPSIIREKTDFSISYINYKQLSISSKIRLMTSGFNSALLRCPEAPERYYGEKFPEMYFSLFVGRLMYESTTNVSEATLEQIGDYRHKNFRRIPY